MYNSKVSNEIFELLYALQVKSGMRIGQIIANSIPSPNKDSYYMSDMELLDALKKYSKDLSK